MVNKCERGSVSSRERLGHPIMRSPSVFQGLAIGIAIGLQHLFVQVDDGLDP